ncbi:MAG: HesA/MoeB/ThiF family protein [Chloroflexota bacterium]|nr:HesA/MoeB/ThiF family protein [Chloroflexota bacterium]
MLSESDYIRYDRQIKYPDFGEKGQKRLRESRVVVAGLGGLGSNVAMQLALAGVGHIDLIDHDVVELSNLNRQSLYWEEDIGTKKPYAAADKLSRLNDSIEFSPVVASISEVNARDVIRGSQAVIDGMDNFNTRFILNSVCVAERIPFIHGGIHGLMGEITTIVPGVTPCLACVFPNSHGKADAVPVIGVIPALIAVLQATEVIKLLVGLGELLTGKMLYVNSETMDFTKIELTRNHNCKVCGDIQSEC